MKGEVVVIGAGHDGLVAAALLARRGLKVTVLEASDRIGGRCAPLTIGDGNVPGLLHDTSKLSPMVVDALDLPRFGLRLVDPPPIWLPGEPPLMLGSTLDGASDGERKAYAAWTAFVERVAPAIRAVMHEPPAEPTGPLWPLARTGLSIRRLGRGDMLELLRVAPTAVGDWLKDRFDEPRLRAALALEAVMGEYLGPWSAGSAALLLLRRALAGREVAGGPAALIAALRAAAEAQGVTIRTGVEVTGLDIARDAIEGVTTSDGAIACRRVLATCSPRHTLLALAGPHRLPDDLALDARRMRCRGTAAKIHLALAGPLRLGGGEVEALRIAPSLDAVERAFDAVKYRTFAEPALDVRVFAGEGGHVASILAHGVPAEIEGGWTAEARGRLLEGVIGQLMAVCDVEILAREVFTPADIEQSHRLPGGHLHHLELAPDQMLFMRPTVQCAHYTTPIRGLYLGGAGTHPGGLITGLGGLHAARAVLGDRR
jgi:phytoene dehydrogenase-like protein